MGQKVNPISLRLETTNRGFDSCYYNHTHSTQLFVENLKLQLYLNNFLKQTGFSGGRVLISTFFKGCETNLFYFNPLYSRENKGKRFMIKSSRIGSGKEKEKQKQKQKKESLVSFFQKNNSKEHNSEEFNPFSKKKTVVSDLIVSDSFLNSPSPSSCSDISKQLSFLVYFYQLVEKRRFFVKFFQILPKQQKDTVFREEKREIDSRAKQLYGKTNLDPFRGETFFKEKRPSVSSPSDEGQLSLKKDKEKPEKIKETPLSFPSVPTLLAFLSVFCSGLNFRKKKDLSALQGLLGTSCLGRVASEKEGIRDFAILPSPQEKQPGRKKTLFYPLGKDSKTLKGVFNKLSSTFLIKRNFPTKEINSHYLEQRLFRNTGSVFYLSFLRALNSTQSALFLCQEIVYYLEKRVSFQRIKSVLLEELSRDNRIKGIRVTCSGRAGGKSKRAQRSKMETFMNGQTSLGVFSSKIDFHCENGLTGFGLVGVKVWICYP